MYILNEITEFFKRKARVRKFKKYRELLEICEQIATEPNKNGQMKPLKDIIRICDKSNYVGFTAKTQLMILKYHYVDGISRDKLRSWGTPQELL